MVETWLGIIRFSRYGCGWEHGMRRLLWLWGKEICDTPV
jgi:hypothetical protein